MISTFFKWFSIGFAIICLLSIGSFVIYGLIAIPDVRLFFGIWLIVMAALTTLSYGVVQLQKLISDLRNKD